MYYKKIVYLFLAISIFTFASIELLYQFYKNDVYSNALQYKRSQVKNAKLKKEYKYAYFGSSISNGVLGSSLHPYKDISFINLTSVGAATLGGNLYLLEELLKRTKLKNVYIGLPYHSFEFQLSYPKVWRHLVDTYSLKNHIVDYKKIDKSFRVNTKPMIKRSLFLKQFYTKYILKKEKYLFEMKDFNINSTDILPDIKKECSLSEKVENKIFKKGKKMSNYDISSLYKYYIKSIKDYENKYNINISIILEPIPLSQMKLIKSNYKLKVYKLLKENNINFYDMNTVFTYRDCMFRDATHLKENFEDMYEYNIIKLTEEKF